MYHYGLIGNCQVSALVGKSGSIDWLCFPRPDSPPVFGALLDSDGGKFEILADGMAKSSQRYIPNSNILVTEIETRDGARFEIVDFCPRFEQHGRMYRPNALFRIVRPLSGHAMIRVKCHPVDGWDKNAVSAVRGNSHLRFGIRNEELRLTSNMSLTHLCDETSVQLSENLYFALTWGVGIEDDLAQVSESFLKKTLEYWRRWVQHCTIPSLYQKEAIRSALALKLHCYEDTGAILAAVTTSLPEESGSERNWDYRYCWLRDSYFVLSALHSLGHFEEMEGFLKFLLGIAQKHEHSRDRLRPVYCLDQTLPLPETSHPAWSGFRGEKPVRSNNQAAEHVQNDVYGEMILTLAPIFFDERFQHLRTPDHEEMLLHLAGFCARTIDQPDAGLWEFRDGWKVHSFSNLLCWAGLERVERIQRSGLITSTGLDLSAARMKAQEALQAAVKNGSLRNGPTDESLDSSLLLLPIFRYPDAKLNRETVLAVARDLRLADKSKGGYLYRYLRQDDFGRPASAFLICSFWLVQALAKVGEKERAIEVMNEAMEAANPLGLFAEHFLPEEKRQLGNFPQAYSHVGLLNAAFALSPPWDEVL